MTYDTIIVGAGIAGASVAHFLAERGVGPILLVERESAPGHHATGRSAAVLNEFDTVRALQLLKREGGRFLRAPPPEFCERPLVEPSGVLVAFGLSWREFNEQVVPTLEADGVEHDLVDPAVARAQVEVLDAASFEGAAFFRQSGNLDVHELLSCYLRHARAHGVELRCNVEVIGVAVERGRVCGIETAGGTIAGRRVVNAAGAWAGRLARMAGALPIEITPKRRSAVTFAAPEGIDPRGWPLVLHTDLSVYFEPEGDGLLMSPMDEAPSEPCDARPNDLTVAEAMERLRAFAPRIVPQALRRRWAGLRTFAPDRVLVVGADPRVEGFFWLAGQGGCGIETSPIVGRVAADLLVDGRTDAFDAALLSPGRFA